MAGNGASDVWLAGAYHHQHQSGSWSVGVLLHWDGRSWSTLDMFHRDREAALLRIVRSGGRFWATGERGLLWRHNGTTWEPLETATEEPIWSVAEAGGITWVAAGDAERPLQITPKPQQR